MQTTQGAPGATADQVRQLREKLGCGMMIAKHALEIRFGDMELAEEYIRRHNLAVVMTDEARFPLYYERMRKKIGESYRF